MRPRLSCVVIALLSIAVAHGQILSPLTGTAKQTTKLFDEKVLTPVQSKINNAIKQQKTAIKSLINVEPDAKFSTIFTDISSFNINQIKECYNTSIGNEEFNIFENSIFDGIRMYYKHFPESFDLSKFPDNVKNLFGTFKEIGLETISCIAKPVDYKVGINQLSDWSEAAFKAIFNDQIADNERQAFRDKYGQRRLNGKEGDGKNTVVTNNPQSIATTARPGGATRRGSILGGSVLSPVAFNSPESNVFGHKRFKRQFPVDEKCFASDRSALPAKLDWNEQGKVTAAKYQGSCGSCWTFASMASLESAYLIKGKTEDTKLDLSEQQLLNCGTTDGCKGGTAVDAFNYLLTNRGISNEEKVPYAFKEEKCGTSPEINAYIKDYCVRGLPVQVDNKPEELNDQEIQMIVREFGPVFATMCADEKAMKNYKSGVYHNPTCKKTTNHAITIVGWDQDSWIIKNSWGRGWGEGGFFRMKRGENMCGLNTYVSYPIV